jgi:hypothetical protein
MLRILLVVICIFVSNSLYARSLDFSLSSESAQINYATLVGATNYGRTELGFGFLYNDDENYLADISLLVIDEAGSKSPGLEIGVGTKFYYAYADPSNVNITAIGLGGQLRYRNAKAPRIIYGATLFYAPGIVTFQDGDQLFEADARIGYEILPTANIYLGYRYIVSELTNKTDLTIDDTFIIGLQYKF